jgi:protein-tyrosine kinase
MDYIQQAIDKARSERQGKIGNTSESASNSREPVRREGSSNGVPGKISYTATRQLELSDSVLLENRIITGFEADQNAEVYRQLRTQVLQKMRANDWQSIAITSPNEKAGKTTTALNLAISLSKEANQTVLLVDLDLRSPGVLPKLGLEAKYGLVDHLNDGVELSEIFINPGFERLVILPGKADDGHRSEILSSPQMKTLVKELTSRYASRIIIFDLPALLVNDDALAFLPEVDAALLVVEDGATTPEEVERCLHLLGETSLLGTLLNKVE